MWLIYEIRKCWNCLINFLKFKHLRFCSNINMVSKYRAWKSSVLCNKLSLFRSWSVEQMIAAMTSIFVWPKDRTEGTSNFNTWKERVLNILEEHELDEDVSTMVEEPSAKEGKIKFKNNQSKEKHMIFDSIKDNLIPVIIFLKTSMECFDTRTNLFKKNALSQEEWCIQRNILCTKEDNIFFMVIMKKGRNPFTTKKLFHSNE